MGLLSIKKFMNILPNNRATVIYSERYEKKIGFDNIRQHVAGLCLSDLGREYLKQCTFSNSFSGIEQKLYLTHELKTILTLDDAFPSDDYLNLIPELKRLNTPGTFIEIEKLIDLHISYFTIQNIIIYLKQREEKYINLFDLSSGMIIHRDVLLKIDRILDEKGRIRDDASEELKKIRSSIISVQSQIEKRTRQILLNLKKENIIAPEVEITVRNGRCVVPVGASNKRKIRGFVHDESATGQTVFIEPAEIFEMNNRLRDLENAERKEIIRILIAFTDFIRPFSDDMIYAYEFLGEIDFIRAKALFAIETDSAKPLLSDGPGINWYKAVNPLLFLHFKEKNKKVVPYDIQLNSVQRIMVISGPNAGGKSVCLKTIGLLQYMLQCGFLIPVKEGSETGLFSDIFIEIGDEQSIENDLSTYSSHLLNLKFFIENVKEDTLFLIDEFGSGTEPVLGGAIAEATLEELNSKKTFGAVTTHYSNIKDYAARAEGTVNASMLFDTVKMQPLFKLAMGNPGSSYALEIADNIGFPKDVTEKATIIAGKERISFEKQIKVFAAEKEEFAKQQEKVKMADEFFSDMIDKYQKLLSDLETQKKQIIHEAQQQAAMMISNTNKTIESTIRQIKESNADKEKTRQLRGDLIKLKEKIISEDKTEEIKIKKAPGQKPKIRQAQPEQALQAPEKGSFVRIAGQKIIGEVIEIQHEYALVLFENSKMKIPVSRLEVAGQSEYKDYLKKKTRGNYAEIIDRINDKIANFKTTLDVRGKRAEEVSDIVEKYIDDALLLKIYNIRILHGKGFGVLRKIIHELLARHKSVVSYENERIENGGDGITVVILK